MRIGDRIEIDGPYGIAYLRTDIARDVVCIAGGSGRAYAVGCPRPCGQPCHARAPAPFLLWCTHAAGHLRRRPVAAAAGVRRTDGLLRDRLSPAAGNPPWHGHTGFVHELVRDTLAPALADHEFYLAGPRP